MNIHALALTEARRRAPWALAEELAEVVADVLAEWHESASHDDSLLPDALESLPNCDDWGTGEGRYHGRM